MNIITLTENATQAKLILKPGQAIIKIPAHLPEETKIEVRNKLTKVADLNKDNKEFLKAYYRIGTPYIFLNKRVSAKKKKTFVTYTYADL